MADKTIIVKNRSSNMVGYSIPEDNIRRMFTQGEEKRIPLSELEKLTYQPGGPFIITNYLQIKDAEAIEELGMTIEPEYNMSAEDVQKLMTEGSLDAFLDCLDFAPEGVIQIIKDLSVKLPLNDVAKRKAIKDKTNFDVDRAIANIQAEKAAELAEKGEVADSGEKKRRVQPEEKPAGRRTTPNYKVVSEE
jgi:hypothetical protein